MANAHYPVTAQDRLADAVVSVAESVGIVFDGDSMIKADYPSVAQDRMAGALTRIAAKLRQDGGVIGKLPVHICVTGEYDAETGEPTVTSPKADTFYLVPTGETSDNMFEEWVYTNGAWEHFGAGGSVEIPQSDWNQSTTTAADYIKNKPAIKAGAGTNAVVEGNGTIASGECSHAEGYGTTASGTDAHAEGANTIASGHVSHAEGQASAMERTIKAGKDETSYTFTPGAYGIGSHVEGSNTYVHVGQYYGHAEGQETYVLSGQPGGHAEGYQTVAAGASHSEGNQTLASGVQSHAEGNRTTASGPQSHAEGNMCVASGAQSHAEGSSTVASGLISHAEGNTTTASGAASHAEGLYTIANHRSQHVFGEYNVADNGNNNSDTTVKGNYIEIVGNGESNARHNARTLDWSGNEWLAGNLQAAGGYITIGSTTISEAQLQSLLALLNS